MNWQFPILMALQSTDELKQRVIESSLTGPVPEHAIHRSIETSNPFNEAYWFPEQASSFAGSIDSLFMDIFWISLAFFVAIVVVMVYFCFRYKRKDGVIDPQPSSSHNTTVEILWSVLPSILLVYMFVEGGKTFWEMKVPKTNSEEIQVIAYKYGWQFVYPNGDTTSELHLVQHQPVVLKMQSKDVLHSFFVSAFRQKQDIVPGRYTTTYIEPSKIGHYRLSCNEYCGDGHSKMRTSVIIHPSLEDRQKTTVWKKPEYTAWENGQHIYKIHCAGCHNINGVKGTGPALNLTWNRKVATAEGKNFTADENYVKNSILNPSMDIVSGYGGAGSISKMNSFKGILSETPGGDIDHVIEYLKYLQDPKSVSDKKLKDVKDSEGDDSEAESDKEDKADSENESKEEDKADSDTESKEEDKADSDTESKKEDKADAEPEAEKKDEGDSESEELKPESSEEPKDEAS